MPETKTEKRVTITLWAEKWEAERWELEGFPPSWTGIFKLFMAAPAICNHYNVETSLCEHFAEALMSSGQRIAV